MVTKSEEQVIKELKADGYSLVHSGCPDFLCYKIKNVKNPTIKDIDMSTIKFIEVKYNSDILHHEQIIWKHILEALGLKYQLIHIPPKKDLGVS